MMHKPFFCSRISKSWPMPQDDLSAQVEKQEKRTEPRPLRRSGQFSKALRKYLTILLSRESFLPPRRFRMMASLVSLMRALMLL